LRAKIGKLKIGKLNFIHLYWRE